MDQPTLPHCVELPRTFTADYLDRSPLEMEDGVTHFRVVKETKRTITLEMSTKGRDDLLDDALFYADALGMNKDVWRVLGPSARAVVRRLKPR